MKRSIVFKFALTFVTFILLISSSFADNNEYSKSKILKKYLERNITFPYKKIMTFEKGIVVVDFKISSNGEITINQINYSNIILKKYVEKKLQQLCNKRNKELFGKSFVYKFNFVSE